ncbi:ribonuclease R [Polluticaenibacter yanchengensis]|uniref:Ribonuclease R n=1 Tax=Polluticaenibacter yanchengensis TaxID=3014562 RepID=A0ABT4UMN8_9BACT|nr:ribonuclease R [Chitinophagaceae bacterium LY-5]
MARKNSNKKSKYIPRPHHSSSKNGNSASYKVEGVIDITRSGIGYIIMNDGKGDVLIRPNDFNHALHGDTVRVKITRDSLGDRKREGVVLDILSRKQAEFIGTILGHPKRWIFMPDSDRPMPQFELYNVPVDENISNGSKIIARFESWGRGDKRPSATYVSRLSPEDMGDFAMRQLLTDKGFPLKFSNEAMADANSFSEEITEEELKKRKDFRGTLTFTIDPVDAKDFDDAISFKEIRKGLYEIGVHIADVSHFVIPGTTLDKEAYERATSVYLPDRVNPMLPEKISNELCSLRPDEDKYAFSTVFEINAKFEIKKKWIGRTVIRSDRRFTYEEAQEIIETGTGDHSAEILLLDKIAKHYRGIRFKNGAINFSSQEVRFKLDEKGKPVGIVVKESKDAHKLIEEFMLLANRTVAEKVKEIGEKRGKPVPFPYRVHDTPDEDKLIPFAALARKFGYTFSLTDPDKIAESFNEMLKQAHGTPQQHLLEQLGIRTMAKAVYTSENIGHYGLGFEDYCHFTSPIRRYPDVMVHRIMQQIIDGTLDSKGNKEGNMEGRCKHCSERERAAMECERSANKYKQVEYMLDYVGDEFDAVVTGVSGFGFWAETVDTKCEGLISIRDLSFVDDFRLIESDYTLVGIHSGIKFRIGDPVRIKVVDANLERRQLDYQWIREPKRQSNGDQEMMTVPAAEKTVTNEKKLKSTKKVPAAAEIKPEEVVKAKTTVKKAVVQKMEEAVVAPKTARPKTKAAKANKPAKGETTPNAVEVTNKTKGKVAKDGTVTPVKPKEKSKKSIPDSAPIPPKVKRKLK